MKMTKLVNGKEFEMSQEEQDAIIAMRKIPDPEQPPSLGSVVETLLSSLLAKSIFTGQEIAAIKKGGKKEKAK